MLASLESPLPPMIASTLAALHGADLGQVAPIALGVHAAAEHEAVRDRKADEIGRNRLFPLQDFLNQDGAVKRARAELEQALANRVHGLAMIQDVVEHEHAAAFRETGGRNAPFD